MAFTRVCKLPPHTPAPSTHLISKLRLACTLHHPACHLHGRPLSVACSTWSGGRSSTTNVCRWTCTAATTIAPLRWQGQSCTWQQVTGGCQEQQQQSPGPHTTQHSSSLGQWSGWSPGPGAMPLLHGRPQASDGTAMAPPPCPSHQPLRHVPRAPLPSVDTSPRPIIRSQASQLLPVGHRAPPHSSWHSRHCPPPCLYHPSQTPAHTPGPAAWRSRLRAARESHAHPPSSRAGSATPTTLGPPRRRRLWSRSAPLAAPPAPTTSTCSSWRRPCGRCGSDRLGGHQGATGEGVT